MSDFLTRLVERSRGASSGIRPRLPSRFDPLPLGQNGPPLPLEVDAEREVSSTAGPPTTRTPVPLPPVANWDDPERSNSSLPALPPRIAGRDDSEAALKPPSSPRAEIPAEPPRRSASISGTAPGLPPRIAGRDDSEAAPKPPSSPRAEIPAEPPRRSASISGTAPGLPPVVSQLPKPPAPAFPPAEMPLAPSSPPERVFNAISQPASPWPPEAPAPPRPVANTPGERATTTTPVAPKDEATSSPRHSAAGKGVQQDSSQTPAAREPLRLETVAPAFPSPQVRQALDPLVGRAPQPHRSAASAGADPAPRGDSVATAHSAATFQAKRGTSQATPPEPIRAEAETVVQVAIGRIEVRLAPPAPSPSPRTRDAAGDGVMSLADYLQRRDGGGRR